MPIDAPRVPEGTAAPGMPAVKPRQHDDNFTFTAAVAPSEPEEVSARAPAPARVSEAASAHVRRPPGAPLTPWDQVRDQALAPRDQVIAPQGQAKPDGPRHRPRHEAVSSGPRHAAASEPRHAAPSDADEPDGIDDSAPGAELGAELDRPVPGGAALGSLDSSALFGALSIGGKGPW
ncbi:MAG: hypothetical protein JO100_01175 [Pseudonocardia sp.]|nr:hypothetical protein [Pseudonocardia sp.]